MNTRFLLLLTVVTPILLGLPSYVCAASDQPRSTKSPLLTGEVESFGILTDERLAYMGFTCKRNKPSLISVDQVRMGGEAYNKGLLKGDVIKDAKQIGTHVSLIVERAGHLYQARIDDQVDPLRLQAEMVELDRFRRAPFALNANRSQSNLFASQNVRVLSNYHLEIMIDRSLSMRRPDCPGGLSRWDWCSQQAISLAQAIAPYVPGGLTITRFAGDSDIHRNASAQDLVDILTHHDFQFGTRLYEPLAARLNSYLAGKTADAKPLLIAIITDGVPFPRPEPRWVKEELIAASQQMIDPKEITIVFFQIGGDDPRGRRYLLNLSNNLVQNGARYQFVHTVSFEELEAFGLAQALVNAVNAS